MNINSELISRKALSSKAVYSLTPFTLLDYPHKTACIIWFAGCNMRCLYCYNPDIVLGKGKLDFQTVIDFLKTRVGLLDAVVLSGGECTMHKNITRFIRKIKDFGFKVKVDTNGSKPYVIQKLINDKLVDYVALDFKSLPASFQYITQSDLFSNFEHSLSILLASNIVFEVRTTLHSELISEPELVKMIRYLEDKKYQGIYFIQLFRNNVPTLKPLNMSDNETSNKILLDSKIKIVFR